MKICVWIESYILKRKVTKIICFLFGLKCKFYIVFFLDYITFFGGPDKIFSFYKVAQIVVDTKIKEFKSNEKQ